MTTPPPGPPSATTSGPPSLEEAYDAHYARLLRFATLLLGDPGRAEDVVHDVFVSAHRRWDSLAQVDDLGAYLRRAVLNGARSAGRHLSVVARHRHEAPGPLPGADAEVLAAERRRVVLDALGRLPRRQREVLALRYYLDLDEAAIAETLGISRGSVKTHASRGAAALRTSLAHQEHP